MRDWIKNCYYKIFYSWLRFTNRISTFRRRVLFRFVLSVEHRPPFTVWAAPPGRLDRYLRPGRYYVPRCRFESKFPPSISDRTSTPSAEHVETTGYCIFLVPDRLCYYFRCITAVFLIVSIWPESFENHDTRTLCFRAVFVAFVIFHVPMIFMAIQKPLLHFELSKVPQGDWPWLGKAFQRLCDTRCKLYWLLLHKISFWFLRLKFWKLPAPHPAHWAPKYSRQTILGNRAIFELLLESLSDRGICTGTFRLLALWLAPVWSGFLLLLLALIPLLGYSEDGLFLLWLGWTAVSALFICWEACAFRSEFGEIVKDMATLPTALAIKAEESSMVDNLLQTKANPFRLMGKGLSIVVPIIGSLYIAVVSLQG